MVSLWRACEVTFRGSALALLAQTNLSGIPPIESPPNESMKTSICKSLTATCGLSLLLAGATAAPARAVLITEYMNGYGPVTVSDVDTLNGGTGWASGWVRDSTAANSARYIANTGLSYGGTGYSNFGNETGLNDGYFQRSSNEPVYSRDFAAPVTTSTIWVSGSCCSTGRMVARLRRSRWTATPARLPLAFSTSTMRPVMKMARCWLSPVRPRK